MAESEADDGLTPLIKRMSRAVESSVEQAGVARILTAQVERLESDPAEARRKILELRQRNRPHFTVAALGHLAAEPWRQQHLLLFDLIAREPVEALLDAISQPSAFTYQVSLEFALELKGLDAGMSSRVLQRLATSHDAEELLRLLDFAAALCDPAHYGPALRRLIRHVSPHVRSKALLLLGRNERNLPLVLAYATDPEARIRANTVEGLWGAAPTDAVKQVLQEASWDKHHRVMANALVGLHQFGDQGSADRLRNMALREEPEFRTAAAWAMGATGDPQFLPALAPMVRDAEANVRRNALKAMVRIRKPGS